MPKLAARPEIVVLSKIDLPDTRRQLPRLRQAFARIGLPLLAVSAVTGEGIPDLLETIWKEIRKGARAEATPTIGTAPNIPRAAPVTAPPKKPQARPPKKPSKHPRPRPRARSH